MDSVFKISNYNNCGIYIQGLESDNGEYLAETSPVLPSRRNYAYSQSITLNVIQSVDKNNNATFISSDFITHTVGSPDTQTVTLNVDGIIRVSHIILPTIDWYTSVNSQDSSFIANTYTDVCYYNNGNIYFNGNIITVNSLLSKNYTDSGSGLTTTIIRSDKDTFLTFKIQDDFAQLCRRILINLPSQTDAILYNRDLIWMFINMMNYSIDLGNTYEAQRYLEEYYNNRAVMFNNYISTKDVTGCSN